MISFLPQKVKLSRTKQNKKKKKIKEYFLSRTKRKEYIKTNTPKICVWSLSNIYEINKFSVICFIHVPCTYIYSIHKYGTWRNNNICGKKTLLGNSNLFFFLFYSSSWFYFYFIYPPISTIFNWKFIGLKSIYCVWGQKYIFESRFFFLNLSFIY